MKNKAYSITVELIEDVDLNSRLSHLYEKLLNNPEKEVVVTEAEAVPSVN
jgi:hypothetical protein